VQRFFPRNQGLYNVLADHQHRDLHPACGDASLDGWLSGLTYRAVSFLLQPTSGATEFLPATTTRRASGFEPADHSPLFAAPIPGAVA
jgi:hypothetical protein